MARRQSILDATSLVRGGGHGLPGTDQSRELTLRGTIARTPSSAAVALHVVTDYDAVQAYEVPAGHWAARGEALPVEGDECLVVFDEQGDVWVPAWSGPYGFPGLEALLNAPLAWKGLPYASNWQDYGGAPYAPGQYAKDAHGRIHIRGLVKTSEAYGWPETKTVIATLPEGFRPAYALLGQAMQIDSATHYSHVRVDVLPDGRIKLIEAPWWTSGGNNGSVAWLTLDWLKPLTTN